MFGVPARPGDDIRKHITASFVNELKKTRHAQYVPKRDRQDNPCKVTARVETDSELVFQRFEAVNLVGPFAESNVSTFYEGMLETVGAVVDDQLEVGRWGIAQGLIRDGYSDEVTVVGMTWALFEYTEGHTHVTIEGGALVSSTSGEGIIIFPPPGSSSSPGSAAPGLILIRGGSSGSSTNVVQGRLTALENGTGEDFEGYKIATITVERTSCGARQYEGDSIRVVDWSECILDHDFEDLDNVWIWAVEDWQPNLDYDPDEEIENPEYDPECVGEECEPEFIPNPNYDPRTEVCGWATLNRCCVSADNATGS